MAVRTKITLVDTLWTGGQVFPWQTTEHRKMLSEDSFEGVVLTEEAVDRFYGRLYGEGWRSGNEDGSRYVPLRLTVEHLDGEHVGRAATFDEAAREWEEVSRSRGGRQ